jgi:hypothetical protein
MSPPSITSGVGVRSVQDVMAQAEDAEHRPT